MIHFRINSLLFLRRQESLWFSVKYAAVRKVNFSYLMNRCLHNTAHPTDGSVISSHYGGLQEGRDLCGRTERLTSSPPDRARGGPLTRVVLLEEPKVGFPFSRGVILMCWKSRDMCKRIRMSRASLWSQHHRNNEQKGPAAWTEGICIVWKFSPWTTSLLIVYFLHEDCSNILILIHVHKVEPSSFSQ